MEKADIEAFLFNLSEEKVDRLKKQEVIDIGAFIGLALPKTSTLAQLKAALTDELVKQRYLKGASEDANPDSPAQPEVEKVEEEEQGIKVRPDPSPLPLRIEKTGNPEFDLEVARLQIAAREKEMAHQLSMKKLEMEMECERELQLKRLEMGIVSKRDYSHNSEFNVAKNLVLVPQFTEVDVEAYFSAFERIAKSHEWPLHVWALVLQSKLTGKAQKALGSMSVDDSKSYDKVKAAVLRTYELVPEAYRQKFRGHKRAPNISVVEFGREKAIYFQRWCEASKVDSFETLTELILIEDLKNCLPERLVAYLNERKPTALAEATILADEFLLTHKREFGAVRSASVAPAYSSSHTPTTKTTVPAAVPSLAPNLERETYSYWD